MQRDDLCCGKWGYVGKQNRVGVCDDGDDLGYFRGNDDGDGDWRSVDRLCGGGSA